MKECKNNAEEEDEREKKRGSGWDRWVERSANWACQWKKCREVRITNYFMEKFRVSDNSFSRPRTKQREPSRYSTRIPVFPNRGGKQQADRWAPDSLKYDMAGAH